MTETVDSLFARITREKLAHQAANQGPVIAPGPDPFELHKAAVERDVAAHGLTLDSRPAPAPVDTWQPPADDARIELAGINYSAGWLFSVCLSVLPVHTVSHLLSINGYDVRQLD